MIDCKLKIGLDYHGVIDQRPKYFSRFCSAARKRGHKIYVITGGPAVKVKEYLKRFHVSYDFIFAISDYYQALGRAVQDASGELVVPKSLWNSAKADFCRRNHINFHIDDSKEYQHWFTTPFCLYDEKWGICRFSSEIKINLNENPENVLKQLENILSCPNAAPSSDGILL